MVSKTNLEMILIWAGSALSFSTSVLAVSGGLLNFPSKDYIDLRNAEEIIESYQSSEQKEHYERQINYLRSKKELNEELSNREVLKDVANISFGLTVPAAIATILGVSAYKFKNK